MNASTTTRPATDADIARVAHAIWESEGCPEGRDREHWQRAREIVERGEPGPGADSVGEPAARPVQPGFEDVPPGTVPDMDRAAADDIRLLPGGRFAKELADLPETTPGTASESQAPREREAGRSRKKAKR